jgi:hypothetical protein
MRASASVDGAAVMIWLRFDQLAAQLDPEPRAALGKNC